MNGAFFLLPLWFDLFERAGEKQFLNSKVEKRPTQTRRAFIFSHILERHHVDQRFREHEVLFVHALQFLGNGMLSLVLGQQLRAHEKLVRRGLQHLRQTHDDFDGGDGHPALDVGQILIAQIRALLHLRLLQLELFAAGSDPLSDQLIIHCHLYSPTLSL